MFLNKKKYYFSNLVFFVFFFVQQHGQENVLRIIVLFYTRIWILLQSIFNTFTVDCDLLLFNTLTTEFYWSKNFGLSCFLFPVSKFVFIDLEIICYKIWHDYDLLNQLFKVETFHHLPNCNFIFKCFLLCNI